MHECPRCGQACDCDGEDLWHSYPAREVLECTCECEDMEEEYGFEGLEEG